METVEVCWGCGGTGKIVDENDQAWCDDCGRPWDRTQSTEDDGYCYWCNGTGVTRIEYDGPNDRGGCVPCSHCRGERTRT